MDEPEVQISELDAHPIAGAKTGKQWTKFCGENDISETSKTTRVFYGEEFVPNSNITILNEDVCDLTEWM